MKQRNFGWLQAVQYIISIVNYYVNKKTFLPYNFPIFLFLRTYCQKKKKLILCEVKDGLVLSLWLPWKDGVDGAFGTCFFIPYPCLFQGPAANLFSLLIVALLGKSWSTLFIFLRPLKGSQFSSWKWAVKFWRKIMSALYRFWAFTEVMIHNESDALKYHF